MASGGVERWQAESLCLANATPAAVRVDWPMRLRFRSRPSHPMDAGTASDDAKSTTETPSPTWRTGETEGGDRLAQGQIDRPASDLQTSTRSRARRLSLQTAKNGVMLSADPGVARPTAASAMSRRPHALIWLLIVLAALIGFVSALTTWVNRQALDTQSWTKASAQLINDPKVRSALSVYIVNELYDNVDVSAQIADGLPPKYDVLAGPISTALRSPAEQGVDQAPPTAAGDSSVGERESGRPSRSSSRSSRTRRGPGCRRRTARSPWISERS